MPKSKRQFYYTSITLGPAFEVAPGLSLSSEEVKKDLKCYLTLDYLKSKIPGKDTLCGVEINPMSKHGSVQVKLKWEV